MNRDATQRPRPTVPVAISSGKAKRISFLTPESEVYVEAPVKFIARYAETAGIIKNHDRTSSLPAKKLQQIFPNRRTQELRANPY